MLKESLKLLKSRLLLTHRMYLA